LPESASTITSAYEQIAIPRQKRSECGRPQLLLTLDEHRHNRLAGCCRRRAARRHVAIHPRLVVRSSPAIEPALALARFETVARSTSAGSPVGCTSWLAIEQDRRLARGAGFRATTAGAPPSTSRICTSSMSHPRKQGRYGLGRRADVTGGDRIGAYRGDYGPGARDPSRTPGSTRSTAARTSFAITPEPTDPARAGNQWRERPGFKRGGATARSGNRPATKAPSVRAHCTRDWRRCRGSRRKAADWFT
jgi:hypothetical protein